MTLKFKIVEEQKEWDNFVKSLPRYSFVQSFKYLNVLKALVNEICRYGVYKDGVLVGLLPLGVIRAKRGDYLRLRHGPILNEEGWNHIDEITDFLTNFAKENKLSFLRIQPILDDDLILKDLGFDEAPTHNLDAEHTLQLNLKDVDQAKILQNMRKNTRYYIRKAKKEGIEVIKENDDFETFYEILKTTAKRQGYTTWPREYFENLFNEFVLDGLNLYFATYQNKKVAIGLFLDFGKYRFYLEGGMLSNYSKKYPAYAVQGKSIYDALNSEVEIYDFWGGVSPKDSKGQPVRGYPWAGIDLFKRGFGGQEVHMVHPHDLKVSWKYKITYWYELYERWKRGY